MSLAPISANPVERRVDAAADDRFSMLPSRLPGATWNLDDLPVEWWPVLAWALSVDLWGSGWPAADRRAAILGSIALHREKGTPAAVKRVLDAIGAVYDYTEPAPFRASIAIYNSNTLRLNLLGGVSAEIDRVKRASVHVTVTLQSGVPGGAIPLAAGLGIASVVRPLTLRVEVP